MVQMQWIVQWKPLAALSSERNSHAQQHVACTANSRSEQWYDGATVTASLQHSTGSAAASITAFTASIAARSGGQIGGGQPWTAEDFWCRPSTVGPSSLLPLASGQHSNGQWYQRSSQRNFSHASPAITSQPASMRDLPARSDHASHAFRHACLCACV